MSSYRSQKKFASLPSDIYRLLGDYLHGIDICRLRKVNKRTYAAINQKYLYSLLHSELTDHDERLPKTNKLLELDRDYDIHDVIEKGYEKKVNHFIEDLGYISKINDNISKDLAYEYGYLGLASDWGYLDIVKYLVSQGADVNEFGGDPLSRASERGYLSIAKYLVSQGADIHAREEDALDQAILNNRGDVVKYLLSEGADSGQLSSDLENIIDDKHFHIIKLLITRNSPYYQEALDIAEQNGSVNVAKYLRQL